MRYLTDRKRATGMGSAKSGVHHFWMMKVQSVALLILIPLFVFTFGPMLGEDHAEVVAYFERPFPAIIAILTFVVGFKHFIDGAQVMIEDYLHGTTEKVTLILLTCLTYAAMVTGVFAIAKIAL
jgi:succinate dehydrogenase / fumarate reductase membrane anchor subunit